MDIYTLKKDMKKKKTKKSNLSKYLLFLILILLTLINMKKDKEFKSNVQKYLFSDNINFSKINNIYEKYAGKLIDTKENLKPVFNEKLEYQKKSKYLEGAKLEVKANYPIPSMESGLVVFRSEERRVGKECVSTWTSRSAAWK